MTAPYQFREFTLRAEMVEALDRYVRHGVPVGDFLYAAICNDFMELCGRADDDNQRNLPALAAFSAVLSKVAAYGFLRIVLPILPDATTRFQEVMMLIALASILYGVASVDESIMAGVEAGARPATRAA